MRSTVVERGERSKWVPHEDRMARMGAASSKLEILATQRSGKSQKQDAYSEELEK